MKLFISELLLWQVLPFDASSSRSGFWKIAHLMSAPLLNIVNCRREDALFDSQSEIETQDFRWNVSNALIDISDLLQLMGGEPWEVSSMRHIVSHWLNSGLMLESSDSPKPTAQVVTGFPSKSNTFREVSMPKNVFVNDKTYPAHGEKASPIIMTGKCHLSHPDPEENFMLQERQEVRSQPEMHSGRDPP